MSTSKKVFDIFLDQYSSESYNVYAVVKTLFSYPDAIDIFEEENIEGLLYACGFAYLMSNYTHRVLKNYRFEDYPLAYEQLEFSEFEPTLSEIASSNNLEIERNLNEDVEYFFIHYSQKISKDIRKIFKSNEDIAKLFASIFSFDEPSHTEGNFMDALNFVEEHF